MWGDCETFCDTLYRYLVLFGIPGKDDQFQRKERPKVWDAIVKSLQPTEATRADTRGLPRVRRQGANNAGPDVGSDVEKYRVDYGKFSIQNGVDFFITRARNNLLSLPGGMDLLLGLCNFDPEKRIDVEAVLTSPFMEDLREKQRGATTYDDSTMVRSFMSYATRS